MKYLSKYRYSRKPPLPWKIPGCLLPRWLLAHFVSYFVCRKRIIVDANPDSPFAYGKLFIWISQTLLTTYGVIVWFTSSKKLSISESFLKFSQNYFDNRFQRMLLIVHSSLWEPVRSSVPQVKFLNHCFLVYINGFCCNFSTNFKLFCWW